MNKFQKYSDKELYLECKKWGTAALEARRRFAGLLPEVYRRDQLTRSIGKAWASRKGYSGAFEFAARLAGMSRDQVSRILQLERKFEALPKLRNELVEGEVSVNKLARIASVATIENQEVLIEKAKILSQRAIEMHVRDIKRIEISRTKLESQKGLSKGEKTVHVHENNKAQQQKEEVKDNLKLLQILSPKVKKLLIKLSEQGHDINEILLKLLNQREEDIEENMQKIGEQVQKEQSSKELIGFPTNRYVPVEVKRIIEEKYGKTCSKEECNRPAEHLHHEKEFAKWKNHDPRILRPLCKAHHELRHTQNRRSFDFAPIKIATSSSGKRLSQKTLQLTMANATKNTHSKNCQIKWKRNVVPKNI